MEATPKNEKTEVWINGQWIEYHLSSPVMNDGYTDLDKDRYQLIGYSSKIKTHGAIFNTKFRYKFFKGSK